LHREHKTSKLKYGLTAKQRKVQKKTPKRAKTFGSQRNRELNKKETYLLVEMFSRVVRRHIQVNCILVDSWFTSIELLKELRSICSATRIIGMYNYTSNVEVKARITTISQLKKQNKKPKRSRKLGYYYPH
jgi:hypothetical protein